MRKPLAFAAAFIAALAAALVPLGIADLTRTEPQPAAKASQHEYGYRVLPGIQNVQTAGAGLDLIPRELKMTCGWHRVCSAAYGVAHSSEQSGIDISAAPGKPVYFVMETVKGGVGIEAMPEYITNSRCKKIDLEIVTTGSPPETLAVLRYTHAVDPEISNDEESTLPTISVSQTEGEFTIARIGQVAIVPPKGTVEMGPAYDNPYYQEDGVSSRCTNEGAHLHQGYDHARVEKPFRNADPDIDLCDNSTDDRGFPSRKEVKVQAPDDPCKTTAVRDETGCFWSDLWMLAVGTSAPRATDRSLRGPGSHCPLRFVPDTGEDRSWTRGRAIARLTLPAAGGGVGTPAYSLSGCPAGLSFDPAARALYGAPHAAGSGTCTLTARVAAEVLRLTFAYRVSEPPPDSPSEPPSTPTGLALRAANGNLILKFGAARASRFQLYRAGADGAFCDPGATGCAPARTAEADASASPVSFGRLPTGSYRARGQGCTGDDSCAWGAFTAAFAHNVPRFPAGAAIGDRSWTQNRAVAAFTLPTTASGGDGTLRYSLGSAPELPAGVNKHPVTHRVSGSPSETMTRTRYTWTVTDGDGDTDSLSFYITVSSPPPARYALTVLADPSSCGTVSESGTYAAGRKAAVRVAWSAGCRFAGWSGGVEEVTTSRSRRTSAGKVTMDGARSVTANFVRQHYLWVFVNPSSCGSASGQGWHDHDATVAIGATANSGCRFLRWRGSPVADYASSSTTIDVTASSLSAVATFAKQCTLTASASPEAGGTVRGGRTYDCNAPRTVTVTAAAAAGYRFTGWSGDASGPSPSATVTLRHGADKAVTASFAQRTYRLSVSGTPGGRGSVRVYPRGPYRYGDEVTVTASPATMFYFSRWSGDVVSDDPRGSDVASHSVTITMTRNKSVTAEFGDVCDHQPNICPFSAVPSATPPPAPTGTLRREENDQ